MRRCYLLPLALFGIGCATPRPLAERVIVTPVPEPPAITPTIASAEAASGRPPAPCDELFTALYVRHEASPRSPAFDTAAHAFDRATEAYGRGRFVAAARGFMKAADSFLAAGDVSDRRWSYGNAVSAWERTNRLEEGRMMLLDAATRDPELAEELRSMALEMRAVCATTEP